VIISGQSLHRRYTAWQNNFSSLNADFDDEHLTFDEPCAPSVQVRNFINGQFVEPISGKYLDNGTGDWQSVLASRG
jgi:hypothetical protein